MRYIPISIALALLLTGMAAAVTFSDNVVIGKNLTVAGTATVTGDLDQIGPLANLNNGESSVVEALNATDVRLDTLETDTSANVTRIETLESSVVEALNATDVRLDTLETDTSANVTRIETLESNDSAQDTNNTEQQDAIVALEARDYIHAQVWDTVLLGATLTNAGAVPLSFEDPNYIMNVADWDTATYAQPDVARVITVTPSGSSTGSITIVGEDIDSNEINETLEWAASSAAKTTTKAFGGIASATGSFAADATFAFAAGDALGADMVLTNSAVVVAYFDGTMETTAPTLSANAALEKNLVTFDTALNSKDLVLVVVTPPVVS